MLGNLNITFLPLTITSIISIIGTLSLLFCSALISGSEVAFFSLSPSDLKTFGEKNASKKASIVAKLITKPKQLLATILVSNNFINIGIVILGTYATNSIVNFSEAVIAGFIFQVFLITFLLLLFGEVIPKVYANQFAAPFASFMAIPLMILDKIFRPISMLLVSSTKVIDKKFQKRKQNLSINELSDALEITSDSISEDKDILKGITEFGSIEVSSIMCPRVDVNAIEYSTDFSIVMQQIIKAGFSRIPIYEKSFDEIKGILFIKDLLPHIHKNDSFNWQNLIRPPYYIPENKKINDLLEELQSRKIHIAVVVDEYGGTSGIITMEDILEEIVGEIPDEFDDTPLGFTKVNDSTYLFEGKTLLNDVYKILSLDSDTFENIKGDADTLAGLILEITGEFPKLHDTITYQRFEFTIEEIDNRRIRKIKTKIRAK